MLTLQVMFYGKIIELPTIYGTNTDIFRWEKIVIYIYDELDSKQKNINLRSCPATNFFWQEIGTAMQ